MPYLTFAEAIAELRLLVGNGVLLVAIGAVIVAAYLPELAHPTFSMDFFYDNDLINSPYYAMYSDGRYLEVALRWLTGNLPLPTLLLLIGMTCLVLCGLLTCILAGVRDRWAAFVVCAIFTTFPFLLEILAYHFLREHVPLAVLLSIIAIGFGGIYRSWVPTLIGVLATFASLNLYQSMVDIGIVLTAIIAALRLLNGERVIDTAVRFVLPRAGAFVGGLVLYMVFVKAMQPFAIMPAIRFNEHAQTVSSLHDLMGNAKAIGGALWEALTANVLLFPAGAKWLFLALSALLVTVIIRTARRTGSTLNASLSLALFALSFFMVFGAIWLVYPAQHLMYDRVLFPLVAVYAGVILSLVILAPEWRKVVLSVATMLVTVYVAQANVWHQYLDLKNRADIDMASKISDRVISNPAFRAGMPMVIVGTSSLPNYLPFRTFRTARKRIRNSIFPSVFAQPDVSYRTLLFFFEYHGLLPADREKAVALSADMPVWPAPGSVDIRGGTILVVLSRP